MEKASVPDNLRELLIGYGRLAVAFSGGCDSSYLLHAAIYSGIKVKAYTVRSAFQTGSEIDRAKEFTESIGANLEVIDVDVLGIPAVRSNHEDRCYHCKRAVFESIIRCARRDGFDIIADGTNATDDPSGRPGTRALNELMAVSPLRICGIGKKEVRKLSREADLPSWDLPSDSCLATRIPAGIPISEDILRNTGSAETELRSLGLKEIRVRYNKDRAVLETIASQADLLDSIRPKVEEILLKYYPAVTYSLRTPHP